MATLPPPSASSGFARLRPWAWAVAAMVVVAILRLMPPPDLRALDGLPSMAQAQAPSQGPSLDQPGTSFPGAAYFLAEDAFAPAPSEGAASTVAVVEPGAGDPHILAIDAGPAALSMPLRAASSADNARALQCLTNAVYYEAGNEPEEGQRAVAQVVLNRIASGRWPASVCGAVYQGGERADRGCQFTFSCDGSMARTPLAAAWVRARRVAQRALEGEVFRPAGLATFYHTLAVHPPWSASVRPVAVIGAHIFYRLPGEAGQPAAYRQRYAGRETAQPGPYAFVAPPRPLPSPPGPDGYWPVLPQAVPPAMPEERAGAAMRSPTPGTSVAPLLPTAPIAQGWTPVSRHAEHDDGLPESTIRPEYRDAGRPLIP